MSDTGVGAGRHVRRARAGELFSNIDRPHALQAWGRIAGSSTVARLQQVATSDTVARLKHIGRAPAGSPPLPRPAGSSASPASPPASPPARPAGQPASPPASPPARPAGQPASPAGPPASPAGPAGPPATSGPRWYRAVQVGTIAASLAGAFFAGILVGDVRTTPVPSAAAAASMPGPTPASATPTPASTPVPAPTVTAPGPTVTVTAPADNTAAPAAAPVRPAPPVQVSIPDLGIDQLLIGLKVKPDRKLEVPKNFDDIGWWSEGPAPGGPGAALVVGHIDSTEGPAVFYKLSTLEVGDVVSVRKADGGTVQFAVTGSETFPKDAFPDALVYRTDGRPSLHLVTCGGTFDYETGHYRDNVVVFADLIEPEAPAPPIEPPAPIEPPEPAEPPPPAPESTG